MNPLAVKLSIAGLSLEQITYKQRSFVSARNCKQKASPILNGENTFGIKISHFVEHDSESESNEAMVNAKTLFMNFDFGRSHIRSCIPSIDKFQRVNIIVIETMDLGPEETQIVVKTLCSSVLLEDACAAACIS